MCSSFVCRESVSLQGLVRAFKISAVMPVSFRFLKFILHVCFNDFLMVLFLVHIHLSTPATQLFISCRQKVFSLCSLNCRFVRIITKFSCCWFFFLHDNEMHETFSETLIVVKLNYGIYLQIIRVLEDSFNFFVLYNLFISYERSRIGSFFPSTSKAIFLPYK